MYGFVYLLGNEAMPCYFKIGCTERSPHERARELSASSGVPHPFKVLLYIEVYDFQRVEARIHRELVDFRASRSREFFCFGPAHMNWLWHLFDTYDKKVSFAAPQWHRFAQRPQFPDDYEEAWVFDCSELCLPLVGPLQSNEFALVAA